MLLLIRNLYLVVVEKCSLKYLDFFSLEKDEIDTDKIMLYFCTFLRRKRIPK